MNQIFKVGFCLFSLVTASVALADGAMQCNELAAKPDSGYSVYISNDSARAVVEEISFFGKTPLAFLKCEPVTYEDEGKPDEMRDFLSCRELNSVDNGFAVSVRNGGIGGTTSLSLSRITFAGRQPVAELLCHLAK